MSTKISFRESFDAVVVCIGRFPPCGGVQFGSFPRRRILRVEQFSDSKKKKNKKKEKFFLVIIRRSAMQVG